jgi:hypothetical protein
MRWFSQVLQVIGCVGVAAGVAVVWGLGYALVVGGGLTVGVGALLEREAR